MKVLRSLKFARGRKDCKIVTRRRGKGKNRKKVSYVISTGSQKLKARQG